MSKKTIKQRIALVAMSALTAGLLTVVATPVANAAAGDVTQNGNSTGIVTALSGSSVTMTADGILSLDVESGGLSIGVSGGKITGFDSETSVGAAPVIAADGSNIAAASSGATYSVSGLKFKPTAAGTNMVIKVRTGNYATFAAADVVAASLKQTITVTVVAAGAAGTFSAGNSFFSIQAIGSSSATVADALYEDKARGGNEIRINWDVKDALGAAMPANTSIMGQVTSGSCVIGTSAAGGTVPLVATTGATGSFFVADTDSADATNCTVVISVNGVARATKNLIFQGPAAKISVTKAYIGKTGTANDLGATTGMGLVTVTDAAGNVLGGVAVDPDTTTYSSIVTSVSITNSGYTSSRPSDTATSVRYNASAGSTPSMIKFTCSSVGGSTTVKLKTSLSNGTTVSSDPIPLSCAGDPNTYTASLDKASYVAGDIATLTITAKDSSGRLTNDAAVMGTGTTTSAPAISGSNMTAVTAPASGDTFSGGSKSYRYVVGATAGSYNMVVDLPYWNATSTVGQTAVTVSYKIASSGDVTNAEVLKSIVALIASINKQIQALQKLILKR
jgi:hypothetical protein